MVEISEIPPLHNCKSLMQFWAKNLNSINGGFKKRKYNQTAPQTGKTLTL